MAIVQGPNGKAKTVCQLILSPFRLVFRLQETRVLLKPRERSRSRSGRNAKKESKSFTSSFCRMFIYNYRLILSWICFVRLQACTVSVWLLLAIGRTEIAVAPRRSGRQWSKSWANVAKRAPSDTCSSSNEMARWLEEKASRSRRGKRHRPLVKQNIIAQGVVWGPYSTFCQTYQGLLWMAPNLWRYMSNPLCQL